MPLRSSTPTSLWLAQVSAPSESVVQAEAWGVITLDVCHCCATSSWTHPPCTPIWWDFQATQSPVDEYHGALVKALAKLSNASKPWQLCEGTILRVPELLNTKMTAASGNIKWSRTAHLNPVSPETINLSI